MVKSLQILWHSVAPFVSSGYGVVTKNVALRIGQQYPLAISCYYGLHPGSSLRIANVRILPTIELEYGRYSVEHYIKKFNINLPILCSDFWPFHWFSKLSNSLCYSPIDSFSYDPEDIQVMKTYAYFIPCSKFGGTVYSKITKRNPFAIIPHGVDIKVYRPYPKIESKRFFNFKRNFVFGVVSANNDPEPRKGWDDLFIAFAKFKERFPKETKNWMIFAHTKPSDARGFNLPLMAKNLGLEKQVMFPEHLPQMVGLPEPEMAKLYSAFDVLVNSSRREGFCLPILEAQACGTPIIGPNSSAVPELVTGHGWLVRVGEVAFTPKGWLCHRVDREDLAKKLEEAYFNHELRAKYANECLQFAQQYDWEEIINKKWLLILEQLQNNL